MKKPSVIGVEKIEGLVGSFFLDLSWFRERREKLKQKYLSLVTIYSYKYTKYFFDMFRSRCSAVLKVVVVS